MRAQQQRGRAGAVVEQLAQLGHGAQQALLIGVRKACEQGTDLRLRTRVERREGALAGRRQAQVEMARILLRTRRLDEAALLQAAQEPAQVAGIEFELARQLGAGAARAMGEFQSRRDSASENSESSRPSPSTPMRRV